MERQEIEEAAERICQRYEEVLYAYFNKILDEIRSQADRPEDQPPKQEIP